VVSVFIIHKESICDASSSSTEPYADKSSELFRKYCDLIGYYQQPKFCLCVVVSAPCLPKSLGYTVHIQQ
jgi:hypothetical protein